DNGETAAGGNAEIDVVENRHAVVGEVQATKFNLALDHSWQGAPVRNRFRGVLDLRLLNQEFIDASHGSGAALEDVDHPSQGDDRPSQQNHVGVEGDKIS